MIQPHGIGSLPSEERHAMQQHLQDCPACREEASL